MSKTFLVIENGQGKTTRTIPYAGEKFEVVFRKDQNRLEIVGDQRELTDEGIQIESVVRVDKKPAIGAVIAKGHWGTLKHQDAVGATLDDVKEHEEKDIQPFPVFLKWTAGVEIALVAIFVSLGWWIGKHENPEPQTVRVFKREEMKMPTMVVDVSPRKSQATPKRVATAKHAPKPRSQAQNGKTQSRSPRAGTDLSRMGALGALGGLNPNSTGMGGLSQAPSKSSGYGFDSSRARGGSNRGMLGKGLVQAGIGGGESLQGYGGYGTSGKGSGQGAKGILGLGGRSGGYYLPLSEDAAIEGGLDRDQINAVIRRNIGQVTYCYERGLQGRPDLSGRVSVHFVISPAGNVSLANVSHTSLDSGRVEACIVDKLRAWKFPKPRGNVAVRVTYPFMLKRLNQG